MFSKVRGMRGIPVIFICSADLFHYGLLVYLAVAKTIHTVYKIVLNDKCGDFGRVVVDKLDVFVSSYSPDETSETLRFVRLSSGKILISSCAQYEFINIEFSVKYS